MARMLGIAAFAVMLAFAAPASAARHRSASSQPHTNSVGTTAANPGTGATTGPARLGSGQAATGPSTSTDAAVKTENEILDRKLKSICRGC